VQFEYKKHRYSTPQTCGFKKLHARYIRRFVRSVAIIRTFFFRHLISSVCHLPLQKWTGKLFKLLALMLCLTIVAIIETLDLPPRPNHVQTW
jgi:hypothetical protein